MLISIIIPVYNVETYLRGCLDSILSQSYHDYEVLLINDGSSDNSGKICDEYAQKNSKIKVFHQINSGVSVARNIGLDNAKGQWITFVDSDDYVETNYLQQLIEDISDDTVDFVIQGFKKIKPHAAIELLKFENKLIPTSQELMLFEDFNINDYGFICSKLYKRDLISNINLRFNLALENAEDLSFMLNYIPSCRVVKFSSETNYNYIIRESSSSVAKKYYKKYINRYCQNKEDIKHNFPDIYQNILLASANVQTPNTIRTLAIRLFSVFPALYRNYVKKNKKSERLLFLKSLDKDDLYIITQYANQLNPVFKFAFKQLSNKNYVIADIIFKLIFTIK